MKRGCEITVSMEKEDLSFKMNERSSFLLPFRRGYIAKGEVYQRYIHQSVEMKRLKALIPSSVHLYTPASSSTKYFSDFLFQNLFDIFFCNIVVL